MSKHGVFKTLAYGKQKDYDKWWEVLEGDYKGKVLKYKLTLSYDGDIDIIVMEDENNTSYNFRKDVALKPYCTGADRWKMKRMDRRLLISNALRDVSVVSKFKIKDKDIRTTNPIEVLEALGYNVEYLINTLEYKISGSKLQLEKDMVYLTQENRKVKVIKLENTDEKCGPGIAELKYLDTNSTSIVYNRINNQGNDNGRVTGSNHDYSYPGNIKIENGEFVKYTAS